MIMGYHSGKLPESNVIFRSSILSGNFCYLSIKIFRKNSTNRFPIGPILFINCQWCLEIYWKV